MKLLYSVPCRAAALSLLTLIILYARKTAWGCVIDAAITTALLFMLPLSPSSNVDDFLNRDQNRTGNIIITVYVMIKIAMYLILLPILGILSPSKFRRDVWDALFPINPLSGIFMVCCGIVWLITLIIGLKCLTPYFLRWIRRRGIQQVTNFVGKVLGYLCCCDLWIAFKNKLWPPPAAPYESVKEEHEEELVQIVLDPVITVESLLQITFRLQHCNLPNELVKIILDYNYKNYYVTSELD